MNTLFLKWSLVFIIGFSLVFFNKIKSKFSILSIILLFFSLIVFFITLPINTIILVKIVILLLFILIFFANMLSTNDYYKFKLTFFFGTIFLIYMVTSLIEILFYTTSIHFYILEVIPIILTFIFYPFTIKKTRLKLDTFLLNFIISTLLFFPIVLFILDLFFKDYFLSSFDDVVFFSFILSVIFVILFSIIKPFLNILSPIYFNIDKKLVEYLSELLSKNSMEETLNYTIEFVNKSFPLKKVEIIKENDYFTFIYEEKKGRPLFAEEFNFLNIIKKQLNTRLKNIYFLDQLQLKLKEIQQLQNKIAEYEVFSLMGQMVATISHQLRNPLAVLRNSMELLHSEDLSETEKEEILISLNEEILHLQNITDNFLNFAKKREIKKTKFEIKPLIEEILSKKNHNHKITIKGNNSLYTSKEILTEILEILINNALDAISNEKDGEIIIEISTKAIKIKDNGIKVKNPEKIFEPFYTTKAKGVGIGLTLAKRLSELLELDLIFKNGYKWKTFLLKWRKNENYNDRR